MGKEREIQARRTTEYHVRSVVWAGVGWVGGGYRGGDSGGYDRHFEVSSDQRDAENVGKHMYNPTVTISHVGGIGSEGALVFYKVESENGSLGDQLQLRAGFPKYPDRLGVSFYLL